MIKYREKRKECEIVTSFGLSGFGNGTFDGPAGPGREPFSGG